MDRFRYKVITDDLFTKGKLKSFKKRQNVLCIYLKHCTAICRNISGGASWEGSKTVKN